MAKTPTKAAASARKVALQLPSQAIQPAGNLWNGWAVIAPADHTIEDCLHPRYLWTKAEQIRPLDYIEIKHVHGNFVLCLDVIRTDNAARALICRPRHVFDYAESSLPDADLSGARIEFLGPDRQWAVVDDHHVVVDNQPTRADAESWLAKRTKKAEAA